MAKSNLVIVESPAKANTVEKYLKGLKRGTRFQVLASIGHVRDLPENRLGVDIEHDFSPRYVIPEKKKDVVKRLRENARNADEIYLATDPDREGEAISWHLVSALNVKDKPIHRVEFNEITKQAVADAFQHPRQIDMQFGTRTARTGVAHHPEIVFFVAVDDVNRRIQPGLLEESRPMIVRFLVELARLVRSGFVNRRVKA